MSCTCKTIECLNHRRAYFKKWYQKNKVKRRKYFQEYTAKFKERRQAKEFVKQAILKGILKRGNCKFCGSSPTVGHHYKGYDKNNWLKVWWLCKKCHALEHAKIKSSQSSSL